MNAFKICIRSIFGRNYRSGHVALHLSVYGAASTAPVENVDLSAGSAPGAELFATISDSRDPCPSPVITEEMPVPPAGCNAKAKERTLGGGPKK